MAEQDRVRNSEKDPTTGVVDVIKKVEVHGAVPKVRIAEEVRLIPEAVGEQKILAGRIAIRRRGETMVVKIHKNAGIHLTTEEEDEIALRTKNVLTHRRIDAVLHLRGLPVLLPVSQNGKLHEERARERVIHKRPIRVSSRATEKNGALVGNGNHDEQKILDDGKHLQSLSSESQKRNRHSRNRNR